MSNNQEKDLTILCVKTDKGCFISDCTATDGYSYTYHDTKLTKLLFDDKTPERTHLANWYYIEKYPTLVQQICNGATINKRYELTDKSLVSEKMPEVIPYEDKDNYNSSLIDSLYVFNYDKEPNYRKDLDCEIKVLCELEDFNFPPTIDYTAIEKRGFSTELYKIKNVDVQHQLLDRMIFPAVMLHERPCKFTSKQMYDITRQYILEHIDNSVAEITSNYDFCFTVMKRIPLIEPETITYQNIFARTKRERNKIHTKVKKYNSKEIFEMTHAQSRYSNYSIIPEMYANSEAELKEKVDTWLEGLMEIINKPLCTCPHCNGAGYIDEIKKEGFSYRE